MKDVKKDEFRGETTTYAVLDSGHEKSRPKVASITVSSVCTSSELPSQTAHRVVYTKAG